MQNNPKISVLLPVYNCELYIKGAIDSILNQTFSDFELLVIDDASTDKTVEIIKSYNDIRINLTQKPKNLGYTDSLNYGLSCAKGEYIARMDGDDFSLPTRFEKQVVFLDAHPETVLCGANYSIIDSEITTQLPQNNDEIQIQFIRNNCIAHPVVMLRNSVLKANKICYDVNKEPAEDFDLWVRLLNYGKLHNLPEVLLKYRVHQKQVSNLQSEKQRNVSVDTKINVFKNLNINWNTEEEIILRKFLSNCYSINLQELDVLKKINKKIIASNTNKTIFNQQLLSKYLQKEENRLLIKYFTNNSNYNLQVLLDYFNKKKEVYPSLQFRDELKLVFKCLSFYKPK